MMCSKNFVKVCFNLIISIVFPPPPHRSLKVIVCNSLPRGDPFLLWLTIFHQKLSAFSEALLLPGMG